SRCSFQQIRFPGACVAEARGTKERMDARLRDRGNQKRRKTLAQVERLAGRADHGSDNLTGATQDRSEGPGDGGEGTSSFVCDHGLRRRGRRFTSESAAPSPCPEE